MNELSDEPGQMGGAAPGGAEDAGRPEVIIGEIPDAHDLSVMLWTARCTLPAHGLLGTFESREDAERLRERHLLTHQELQA